MENSMASMSKARKSDEEESSWTFYFEDFLCDNNERTSFSSGNESRSLVSDAASLVTKKFLDNDLVPGFSLDKGNKKLSFKKRKNKGPLVDDALEDTASSPVNSPKVCYLNQLDMNRKAKDIMDISEEKGNAYGQTVERSELVIVGKDSDQITELKKRGLCLVPVSMLANYLG